MIKRTTDLNFPIITISRAHILMRNENEKEEREILRISSEADDEVWEDADDVEDSEVDEVVEESASDSTSSSDEEDDLPEGQITYGDTDYELVLPSGARIGHRSMRRYYAQSFPGVPRGSKPEDPNSGAALVRRLLADKNAALVPRRGGFRSFRRWHRCCQSKK
jgi:pre-60S factor REI1